MPEGEEMFKIHGYSGDCPKPPLPRPPSELELYKEALEYLLFALSKYTRKEITDGVGRFKDCPSLLRQLVERKP